MYPIVNSKSNLTLFTSLGCIRIHDQMAGETSGPGPSEQEIRMVALERKFDELLSFVQLIAKRNTDDENQRKEDDKDTSEGEPEGHSNTNATPPRCHNPIFTPGIFSGVGAQNKTARTKPT
jgi:hypothetical protein